MFVRSSLSALAIGAVVLSFAPGAGAAGQARDSDHDGMPNRYEQRHGLDPHNAKDARTDLDHDGLRNRGEYRNHTDLRSEDTDSDGADDGDEVGDDSATTDPTEADTDDDGTLDGDEDADHDGTDNEDADDSSEPCVADDDDTDADGLADEDENDFGTSPTSADSDDDGTPDGDEDGDGDEQADEDEDDAVADECDGDLDHDGQSDEDAGDQLGTITAFDSDTGDLSIERTDTTVVTYVVTEDTEVRIEQPEDEGGDDSVGTAVRGHGGHGDAGTLDDLRVGVDVAEVDLADDGTVEEIQIYATPAL